MTNQLSVGIFWLVLTITILSGTILAIIHVTAHYYDLGYDDGKSGKERATKELHQMTNPVVRGG